MNKRAVWGLLFVLLSGCGLQAEQELHFLPDNKAILFYQHDTSTALFHFTPDREGQFIELQQTLPENMRQLQALFGIHGLDHKPAFWICSDVKAMQQAIRHSGNPTLPDVRELQRRRVWKQGHNTIILFSITSDLEQIQRLVLQEFASQLVQQKARKWSHNGIYWFQTGMAAYLAWSIGSAPQESSRLHARMIDYYSYYFDPDQAFALESLEDQKEWQSALLVDANQVFGESVLAYLFFASRYGAHTGIHTMERMNDPAEFEREFERSTGTTLFEFEQLFRRTVFPQVQSVRKKHKQEKRDNYYKPSRTT